MEQTEIKKIIEALLFISDNPVSIIIIKEILGVEAENHDIEKLILEIGEEYQQRNSPIELRFIAGGWQFSTKKDYSVWVKKLYKEKTTLRLSSSALETLSIIAYKQPMTRSEIEEIRGVEVIAVLETLLERKLIQIVGRKETIGRPLLYGTTTEFLRHFGLTHISELPSLEEITPTEETASDSESEITVSSAQESYQEDA